MFDILDEKSKFIRLFNRKLEETNVQGYHCYQVNNIDILGAKLEIMKQELPLRQNSKASKILKPYLKKEIKIGLIYMKRRLSQREIMQDINSDQHLYKLYKKMMEILSSQDDFVLWFWINFSKLSDFEKIIDAINNRTSNICPYCCSYKFICPNCHYCKFLKLIGQLNRKEFLVLIKSDNLENNQSDLLIDITKLSEFENRIDKLIVEPCLVVNPLYQIKDLLKGYGRYLIVKNEKKIWIKEFKTTNYTHDDICGLWYFTFFSLHENFSYDVSGLCELLKLYIEMSLHFNM